jgi:hypothetical protein
MITRRIPLLILLFIIITIVAAGVSGVLIHNPGSTFWQCIIAGMLLGWIIGSVKRSSWYAGFLIVFLGIIFILFFTSGIEKLFWSVFIGLSRVSGHIASLATVEFREVFSLLKQEYQLARAVSVVLERSSSWLIDFGARQPGFDPIATGLIWNLVIWIVAAWAGWIRTFWPARKPMELQPYRLSKVETPANDHRCHSSDIDHRSDSDHGFISFLRSFPTLD